MSHATGARVISLIRHGKVAGAPALYGRTDIALSTQGEQDLMCTLSKLHEHTSITQVISSPKIRCAKVAGEFSLQHKIPLVFEAGLQEMDFGIWDGVPFDELGDEWNNIEQFWHNPASAHAPKGETLQDFANRVIHSWETFLNHKNAQHSTEHSAIICHGGVIRILIAHVLQLDWRNPALFKQLQIDYASCTRISIANYDHAQPQIHYIGLQHY